MKLRIEICKYLLPLKFYVTSICDKGNDIKGYLNSIGTSFVARAFPRSHLEPT